MTTTFSFSAKMTLVLAQALLSINPCSRPRLRIQRYLLLSEYSIHKMSGYFLPMIPRTFVHHMADLIQELFIVLIFACANLTPV